jgi:hypothetical protein
MNVMRLDVWNATSQTTWSLDNLITVSDETAGIHITVKQVTRRISDTIIWGTNSTREIR